MELTSGFSILILGFLVLVFGSILRRRASDQLQFWFLGWVLLLLHLLAGLIGPAVGIADQLTSSLSSSATILAGLAFVLAVFTGTARDQKYLAAAVGIPSVLFANAVSWNVAAKPVLMAIISAGGAGILGALWYVYRVRRPSIYAAAGTTVVIAFVARDIVHGDFAGAIYGIQAGLFFCSGLLFTAGSSAGRLARSRPRWDCLPGEGRCWTWDRMRLDWPMPWYRAQRGTHRCTWWHWE